MRQEERGEGEEKAAAVAVKEVRRAPALLTEEA
jgi:hypothetical protein